MLTARQIMTPDAQGADPAVMTAGEFGGEKPITIGADDSIDEAIATMQQHQVRRLPVIDGHDVVGIIAQADIAQAASDKHAGELVKLISA